SSARPAPAARSAAGRGSPLPAPAPAEPDATHFGTRHLDRKGRDGMYVVGVDVGGTFTDVVVYDTESRQWRVTKVPSTPPDFMEGFVAGVAQACGSFPSGSLAGVGRVVHGTTVATNAI